MKSVATNANLPTITTSPVTNGQAYSVVVGGQNLFVVAGSLSVDNTIGKRGSASFTAYSSTATHFEQYEQIQIYDQSSTLAFSGYLTTPKEQKPGFQPSLIHTITATDQHYLADKRVINASYTNRTCGSIVQDILNTILSQEGVTTGLIYDGPTPSNTLYPSDTLYPGGNIGLIPSATFAYCTVAQAMDALVTAASSSGVLYYWMIDQYKKLWFAPYTAVVNAAVVDGSQIDQVNNPCYVQRSNPTYRNQQYILGGVTQTLQQTETRLGDGNVTAWTFSYDMASTPALSVNGVAKTVGVKGVDTGKDFYWQQGSPIITQDSAATKLTGAQTLQNIYIGQYPSVIIANNQGQIAYQAAIDGSSGIVEEVTTDATITSASNGLALASQLLTRYAAQGTIIQFSTRQTGYQQGQLITVNLPFHQLYNAQMLIEDVTASDQTDLVNIWYTVTAVSGPYDVTWQDFFSKMLQQPQQANSINVGVSQSVTLLASFTGTIGVSGTLTTSVYACPVVSNTLYPSDTLYPC